MLANITHLASHSRKGGGTEWKSQLLAPEFALVFTRFHLIALISALVPAIGVAPLAWERRPVGAKRPAIELTGPPVAIVRKSLGEMGFSVLWRSFTVTSKR